MGTETSGGETSKKAPKPGTPPQNPQTLIDMMPAALLVIDPGGRIRETNVVAVDLFGVPNAGALKGRALESLIIPTPDPGVPFKELITSGKKTLFKASLHRQDGRELAVQVTCGPSLDGLDKTIILISELTDQDHKTAELITAYEKQKQFNQKLAEIMDLGRTFSRQIDIDRVLDRVVRVISDSLGYGFVGLYMKDNQSTRMRVATYSNPELDITDLEDENPGKAWDLLMLVTQNPKELKKVGATRLVVKFGMETALAGQGKTSELIPGGTIWRLGDSLIALIQLDGQVTGGYIKVNHPLHGNCRKENDPLSIYSETFCQQALWIYANHAAVAIDSAILLERAKLDLDEHTRVEKDLVLTKEDLEKRILQRTRELENLNTELRAEIKEREVAQKQRDQQARFLRQVLDTNPSLIYSRDRSGRYILINETAARFEGLTIDEILGKTDNDLHHDLNQIVRWRHEDLDVIDNRKEINLQEERIVDTHGVEHYLQTIKRPIVGPDGKIDQMLGVSIEITARKKAEERVLQANTELAQAYDATIEGWSRALDLRDRETEGHSLRVTNMTLLLAGFIGIDQNEHLHLRRGALLHDIGKMGIPDEILFKKGALNAEEWVIMRKHPIYAYDMLHQIEYLHPALVIPKYHHEKWDGTGYPENLEGDMIPLPARIFALVDVWDALTSDRPYRAAWKPVDVLEYVKKNSGSHFDPQIVKIFVKNINEIVANIH